MKIYDLHIHSCHSDGDYSPPELISRAQDAGLAGLILTDHDTILGQGQFVKTAGKAGFAIAEGVEFSALAGPTDVHILGYSRCFKKEALEPLLDRVLLAGYKRMEAIVQRLDDAGVARLDLEAIQQKKGAGAVLCKYDLQKAMTEFGLGITESGPLLSQRESPFYVGHSSEYFPSSIEVINAIHQAGGIAVLAHPFKVLKHLDLPTAQAKKQFLDSFVAKLAEQGLDGLEAYYGPYTEDQVAELVDLAVKYGLALSGGSDFHGDIHTPNRPFGLGGVSEEIWQNFWQKLG